MHSFRARNATKNFENMLLSGKEFKLGGKNGGCRGVLGDSEMMAARPKTSTWETDRGNQTVSPNEDAKERRKYKRRTVEFHEDIENAIDILQQQLRLRSHTDVLQKAVQVLSILVGDEKDGRPQIFVKKDGKMQEIIIV